MIIHNKKIIFVHIEKTGGTSIESFFGLNSSKTFHGKKKHLNLMGLKSCCGNKNFDEYYKFTIVRNPWDLLLSLHEFCYTGTEKFKEIMKWKLLENTSLYEKTNTNKKRLYVDIDYYHKWKSDLNKKAKYYWGWGHWIRHHTQLDWISEDGNIGVDYICRFENLQEDFNKVCEKLNITETKLPHSNKTKNKDKRNHYSTYYDDELRDIVADKFKRDIEYFNYTFEDKR